MHRFSAIKLFFVLAAVVFIAKPFVGFSVYNFLRHANHKVILIKAFTKRKPEYFAEAEVKKAAIHQSLSNPPTKAAFTLAALLAFIFPLLPAFKSILHQTTDQLIFYAGRKTCLLTGKLTI